MKLFFLSVVTLLTTIGVAETFNTSNDRIKFVLSQMDDAEAFVCKTDEDGSIDDSCFFIVDNVQYYTPTALEYWSVDDSILPNQRRYIVSDYYNADAEKEFLIESNLNILIREKKPKEKEKKKPGHGSNNLTGNRITISIGSNSGAGSSGDKSCRSCHPNVHPGFGAKNSKK